MTREHESLRTVGTAERSGRTTRLRLTDRTPVAWLTERIGSVSVLLITAIVVVVPVAYVFAETIADNFDGIRRLFRDPYYGEALRTTIVLSVGSVTVAIVVGTALGWWAHGLPAHRRWLGMLPIFPLVIPSISLLLGFIFLINPTIGYLNVFLRSIHGLRGFDEGPINIYTVPWMIIFAGLGLSAFVFLFVRSSLSHLPQDLIDAGSSSGASPRRTFWRIILPLLRPALTYGALTVAVLSLGQFTTPLFLGRQGGIRVLTTEVFYRLNVYPVDRALAASYGLTIVVAGMLCLLFQRWLLRNQERYVTASGRGNRPYQNRRRLPQVGLALYGVLTILLPLASLIVVSLQPFWSKNVRPSDVTLNNFFEVFRRDDLLAGIKNSLLYAVATSIITVPLAYMVSRTIHRRRRKPILAGAQDVAMGLPLGVPNVIMGTGFLLLYLQSPLRLYGNALGVVIVYVVIMLPFAARLLLTAMSAMGDEFSNAAAVCGASPLKRALKIDFPLLRPAMGAAAALVVVLTTHEFSASILVRSRSTSMMGPLMYDLWTYGSYSLTAVMALIMCVVTGAGIFVALTIGGTGTLTNLESEDG